MTSARLSKTERTYNQKPLPSPLNPRNYRQSTRRLTFHKVRRLLGIQQCPN